MADAVRIQGLSDLRKDLRGYPKESRAELSKALRAGAHLVAKDARPFAARQTGRLAAGFRPGAAGNTAFVRNRVPYAGVQEFGGRISPRGTPFRIRAHPAASRALENNEEGIVDAIGDALDRAAVRGGWH